MCDLIGPGIGDGLEDDFGAWRAARRPIVARGEVAGNRRCQNAARGAGCEEGPRCASNRGRPRGRQAANDRLRTTSGVLPAAFAFVSATFDAKSPLFGALRRSLSDVSRTAGMIPSRASSPALDEQIAHGLAGAGGGCTWITYM